MIKFKYYIGTITETMCLTILFKMLKESGKIRTSSCSPILESNKILKLFCISIFIFIQNSTFGQNDQIKFRDPLLPLSENSVQSITEDYKGFMWFGTESGLNRYDGTNMNIYGKIFGDSTSLSNNRVLSIYETKNKELWVGTSSGLNLYNRDKNNFTHYYYEQSEGNNPDFNIINGIIEDEEGDIWLATQGGTCIFNRKNNKFFRFNKFSQNKQKFKDGSINTIVIDKKGRVIAGTDEGKVLIYDKKNGKIIEHFFDNGDSDLPISSSIRKLTVTGNGLVWASTVGAGLVKMKKIENGHIWYDQYVHNPADNKSISNNYIDWLCEFREDEILVGTINGGLNKFSYATNNFERFQKSSTIANSIGGNSIWAIYKDKKSRVWIGIFNVGVNIIDSLPQKFTSYKNLAFDDNSLTHSSITSFLEDSEGNIWLTSDGGGLDYWDRKTNKFTHFRHDPNDPASLMSNAGLCLYRTREGELWVGCYAGAINILEKDRKTFRHITTEDGLITNNVFSMVEGKHGEVYISAFGGGMNVYNPDSKELDAYTHDPSDESSLGNDNINVLYVDKQDNLWIGLDNSGLDLMKKNEKGDVSFIHYKHNPKDINSLSDNNILAIIEDKNGNLWLGTRDGLNKLNKETQEFTIYRTSEGLPNNAVVGIIEDDKGNLWLSTLNGLSMFNPKTQVFKNYNESDGLQGKKFNNRASYYKNADGEFFFGGNEGFSTFHPNKIQYDHSFPRLYIVDFKLFNKEVIIGKRGSPLKKHIVETLEITLTHKQSVFSLEYVALNFTDPEKTQYAYMLEGLETEWNFVGAKRTATYTNLDAGEYIFRVKSTNREGEWNQEDRILKIIILPPWWKTWWFLSIVAFVTVFGIVLFVRMRTRQLKQTQKRLEAKVKEATEVVKSRNVKLKEASGKLASIMDDVKNQLGKASEELLDATNSQATSIEEISASMEQMARGINENALGASEMFGNAQAIEKEAESSVDIVSKTVSSIEDITEGIGFISEFARLTNLLSLNAAIEAARAGVHGKSFAVVAKQVKKLADQSQKVAVDIKKLSASGLNLSHNANTKINDLKEYIKSVVILIAKISESSQNQSSEANNINLAIQQISTYINKTTQLAEKLDTAINSLTIEDS